MTTRTTAYDVGVRIVTYQSTIIHAASAEEAIAKARALYEADPDSWLFDVTTDPEEWRADEALP